MALRNEWTLSDARAALPEIRLLTERAVAQFESLGVELELEADDARREAIGGQLQDIVSRWAEQVVRRDVVAKGLWLVDFDSGAGYWCWKWPETDVLYFHGYGDGFAGRVAIQ